VTTPTTTPAKLARSMGSPFFFFLVRLFHPSWTMDGKVENFVACRSWENNLIINLSSKFFPSNSIADPCPGDHFEDTGSVRVTKSKPKLNRLFNRCTWRFTQSKISLDAGKWHPVTAKQVACVQLPSGVKSWKEKRG
jgi:hypothetical protein